jgi:hypothetical protein
MGATLFWYLSLNMKNLFLDLYWYWRRFAEPLYAWSRSKGDVAEKLKTKSGQFQLNRVFAAVTHICNARCGFCAYPLMKPAQEIMSFDLFDVYLDQWKAMGGKRINLTPTFGDPLLDPGICRKIVRARELGFTVSLTTNGIKLLITDLAITGLDNLDVSVPSWDRQEYIRVYGVDKLKEVVAGLHDYQMHRSLGQKLQVHFRHACRPSLLVKHPTFAALRELKPENFSHSFTYGFDNWMGQVTLPEGMWQRQVKFGPHACRWAFALTLEPTGLIRVCGCRYNKEGSPDMVVGDLYSDYRNSLQKAWDNAQPLLQDFFSGKRRPTCEGCTFYQAAKQDMIL